MATNDSRPINLDLTKFSFPITAIASITHRVCAVISWVGLGVLLAVLCSAQGSLTEFNNTAAIIQGNIFLQFCVWGMLSAFAYYCLGTAKHIIQDVGYFEDFEGGKLISWATIVGGIALAVALGVLIWA